MGWQRRRHKQFYYRSQRVDGRVRTIYLGGGETAKQAAEKDAEARVQRAADKAELATLEAKLSSVDQLAAEVQHGVGLMTEATLLAIGYREHRGQWRRRRDVD